MELVIPDGTQVYITVGHPPPSVLADDQRPVVPSPKRSGSRLLAGLGIGLVIVVAFEAGRLLPHEANIASAALPSASLTAADVPQAFRAQMEQPPQVVPAPGAVPGQASSGMAGSPGASAKPNSFGLQE